MGDSLPFLAKGLVLGFSIAAPVGPIGVLCFRRALAQGFWPAVAGGLGTAVADAAYAAVAAFGITAASAALLGHQRALAVVGGIALVWLGVRAFLSRPPERAAETPTGYATSGFLAMFAATFLLTLANPATLLSFAAVFVGLGLVGAMNGGQAAGALTVGVFAGSMLWWIILSGAVSALRARVPRAALVWVNRISGVLLGGFGLWVLRGAFAHG